MQPEKVAALKEMKTLCSEELINAKLCNKQGG
jgi:hypothetical protein